MVTNLAQVAWTSRTTGLFAISGPLRMHYMISIGTIILVAQVTVVPGDTILQTQALQPFTARYRQGPAEMTLLVERDQDEVHAVFIIPTPMGVLVDRIGHDSRTLALSYRIFDLNRFGLEAIRLVALPDSFRATRQSLDGTYEGLKTNSAPFAAAFDGTFSHWLVASVKSALGETYRLPRWSVHEDGITVGASFSEFLVEGRVRTEAGGISCDCRVLSSQVQGGVVKSYISDTAPYLLRQEFIPEGGVAQEVLVLDELMTS